MKLLDCVVIFLIVDIFLTTYGKVTSKYNVTTVLLPHSRDNGTNQSSLGNEIRFYLYKEIAPVLSIVCFVSLFVVCCLLCKVRKRLINLERKYTTSCKEKEALIPQYSNQSNLPADIESIPRVPRRSEYIRQKMVNVGNEIQKFTTRVSRSFTFGSTPRSSADTFDLSNKEDPIYDDILQYRKTERSLCCCCCKSDEYVTARTSDQQIAEIKNEQKIEITYSDVSKAENVETIPQDVTKTNSCLTKKKKSVELNHEIKVQHVEFDARETCIQPKNTDDVTIGVSQKQVKHINKEHQLSSFGKKCGLKVQTQQSLNVTDSQKPVPAVKKKITGVKLPLPLPIKPAKPLPPVNEEVVESNDMNDSDKERDPSYIDMSETLRTKET